MEEEEHTDRKQQLAAIYQKLNKIKKSLDEGMRKITPSEAAVGFFFLYFVIYTLCSLIITSCNCYR